MRSPTDTGRTTPAAAECMPEATVSSCLVCTCEKDQISSEPQTAPGRAMRSFSAQEAR